VFVVDDVRLGVYSAHAVAQTIRRSVSRSSERRGS
jgi:hypothetical protein